MSPVRWTRSSWFPFFILPGTGRSFPDKSKCISDRGSPRKASHNILRFLNVDSCPRTLLSPRWRCLSSLASHGTEASARAGSPPTNLLTRRLARGPGSPFRSAEINLRTYNFGFGSFNRPVIRSNSAVLQRTVSNPWTNITIYISFLSWTLRSLFRPYLLLPLRRSVLFIRTPAIPHDWHLAG